MRLVRERTVRIKEIFDVPDDLELDPEYREDAPGVTLISQRAIEVGAAVLRTATDNEPAYPAPDPKHQEAAERGYWSRLVRAWRTL